MYVLVSLFVVQPGLSLSCVFFCAPSFVQGVGGDSGDLCVPPAAAAKAGAQCLQGSQPGYTTLKPTVPHKLPRIHSLVLTVPSEVLPHTHPGRATYFAHCEV